MTSIQDAGSPSDRPDASPPSSPAPSGFSSTDVPRVLGRYLLLRRIARGGMGEVYLASTLGLEGAERPVVVKLIRREHIGDKSFLARFLDEARVQAQLSHPGVAQVMDAATDEATAEPYVVVEHVDGRSLGDLRNRSIQMGVRLRWPEAVALCMMIGEALGYVHERRDPSGRPLGIVHRDLSPQNVMVSFDGDVKLIDFGTARGQNRRCHTVAGVVFAKPGYVAPEVANGDSGDGRVDLYALGVILWELCVGKRFLQGEASDHMAAVARNERNLPSIAANVNAPEGLDAVIAKLTAFDREARYASGRDAARDLAKVLSQAPPLENGERGIRARTHDLMQRMFRDEPARARRAFARLLESSRAVVPMHRTPSTAPPASGRTMADEPEDRLPGTRYRLVREIGTGASSVVYEAEHVDLGRRVAVKVLAGPLAGSKEYAARFRSEAQILSKLSHPSLAHLHDFGETTDGRLFCVMELCQGETLDKRLAREQMPLHEALRITLQTLRALEVAHGSGLVHRDIKPQNLFLTEDGAVKLLDFGLAVSAEDVVGDAEKSDKAVMKGITLFGTPEYMAPEQASGHRVDGRADLYAVGCVLYEMITASLPFAKGSAVKTLEAKIKGSPERPCNRAPERDIPVDVDELAVRSIARHPSLRFQSAEEMSAAIEAVLAASKPPKKGRRYGMMAVAAAAMAGLIGLHQGGDLARVGTWISDQGSFAESLLGASDASEPVVSSKVVSAGDAKPLTTPPERAVDPTVPVEASSKTTGDGDPDREMTRADEPREAAVSDEDDVDELPAPEPAVESPRPRKPQKVAQAEPAPKKASSPKSERRRSKRKPAKRPR